MNDRREADAGRTSPGSVAASSVAEAQSASGLGTNCGMTIRKFESQVARNVAPRSMTVAVRWLSIMLRTVKVRGRVGTSVMCISLVELPDKFI